jgi:hypothetical protein
LLFAIFIAPFILEPIEVRIRLLCRAFGIKTEEDACEAACRFGAEVAGVHPTELGEGAAVGGVEEGVIGGGAFDTEGDVVAVERDLLLDMAHGTEVIGEGEEAVAVAADDGEVVLAVRTHIDGEARFGAVLQRLDIHRCRRAEGDMLLASADEGGRVHRTQRDRCGGEPQEALACGERVVALVRVAEVAPLSAERRSVEVVARGSLRHLDLREGGAVHLQRHGAVAVDDRPGAFVPPHGSEERLPSQEVVRLRLRSEGEEHHPPGAVGRLHEVGMSCALYRTALCRLAEMCEDGVRGSRQVRAADEAAACDGLPVAVLRAAFGDHQVVIAVLLIEVRAFGIASSRALPYLLRLREQPSRGDIYLAELYLSVRRQEIALPALVVEEQFGVDASLFHPDGVRPRACGVGGGDVVVATVRHVGVDHIEHPFVVADGRRIQSAPCRRLRQVHLRGAADAAAYLFPVDEVLAAVDGDAGEILEGAVHEVELVAHAADTRVGVEARQDGVGVTLRHCCRRQAEAEERREEEMLHSADSLCCGYKYTIYRIINGRMAIKNGGRP